MDLLGGYKSNSESDGSEPVEKKARKSDRRFLRAAPATSIMTRRRHGNELIQLVDPATQSIVQAPVQGPQASDPHAQKVQAGEMQENYQFDQTTFKKQRTKFQRTGQATGPNKDSIVRTTLGYTAKRLEQFEKKENERKKRPKFEAKDPLVYGSDDEAVYGVWAPPSKEERWHADNELSDIKRGGLESLAPEQLAEREYIKERDRLLGVQEEAKEEQPAWERLVDRKMAHLLPPKMDGEAIKPKSTFHGLEETDYKGQSWMAPPSGMRSVIDGDALDVDHHKCYVPKKCVHRFTGNARGIHRIRLFPKTGHLLLSGGLDGVCKVWSVTEKRLMRSYYGHAAAVRDVQFNNDGSKFVSASFDRSLRLWDTESGESLNTFGNKKVPYVVKFYPHDDNFFVAGCSDNKIVTYDVRTAEITQEYNHHLAPVNAIIFVEDSGTKMVSSSDDKKVLVWEWDIGVPVKYISDPTMHSMPCMVMHPSMQFFVTQSLDNTMCVFQAGNRFSMQKKKKFSGHQVAGYACEMTLSPDGRFLACGDGKGKLFFWDWKRHKILQKYHAHDKGPAIASIWHPLEPSIMFTCGWDGVIKMWE